VCLIRAFILYMPKKTPIVSAPVSTSQVSAQNEKLALKSAKADITPFIIYCGQVHKNKDGSAVLIDVEQQQEIFIEAKYLNHIWHMDTINIQVKVDDFTRTPCSMQIIKRGVTHVLGKVVKLGKIYQLQPDNHKLPYMHIESIGLNKFQAQEGNIVYAQVVVYPDEANKIGVVNIVEVMDEFDSPGIEIDLAIKKYHLPYEFSALVEKELSKIPHVPHKQDYNNRVDLRDIYFVTIDGEDARDFDDAVYCEPCTLNKNNDAWRLLVAIADVSHYVNINTALDTEALNRATSVYFPRKVIPMLPEKLSNGLCSLNPHVDRLCMVCDMVVDKEGHVQAYQFYEAVMHSKMRLTYTQVAEKLDKINLDAKNNPQSKKNVDALDEASPHLISLHGVFSCLLKERVQRGAIDFDTEETQMVCADNGKIEKIIPRKRNQAHRIIEECMLAANVCAADYLQKNHLASLYRVHALPNPDKLLQLQQSLQPFGIQLRLDKQQQVSTKDIAKVLDIIKLRPDAKILQTMILRTMQQAVYDSSNVGHYGLAYRAYTHFTSPIRRYPDLLVHRSIKAILNHTKYVPHIPNNVEMHQLPTHQVASIHKAHYVSKQQNDVVENIADKQNLIEKQNMRVWHTLGKHCSALERRADEASRDVEAWLKCHFMQSKVGHTYSGVVSTVVPFGLFVQLQDLYIEGLIHVSELGKDYFIYDEHKQQMCGKNSHKIFKIGDSVNIQVTKVDIASRKIDFKLVTTPTHLQAKAAKQPKENNKENNKEVKQVKYTEKNLAGTPKPKNNKTQKTSTNKTATKITQKELVKSSTIQKKKTKTKT
jgi:ribonuclease R